MKRIKYLGVLCCWMFIGMLAVHAAPTYSFTSSSYTTVGSSVTATLRITAAAWDVTIVGGGATSGCNFREVGDSGTGKNTTRTFTATCRATNVGQISFSISGDITDEGGANVTLSGTKTVSVQAPRQKDANNYLASLGVKDYPITPEFNKETLEYSINVPNTVNKVTLEGTAESRYASINGLGEVEVNEGSNKFEIKVVSETGVERVYTITVNVKDENPIEVPIKNGDYTIMKNAKTLQAPNTYIQTTVTINNFEIPAFYSEISNYTLIGVKDSKGETFFAIYNKEKNTYELYNENQSSEKLLFIKPIPEELLGFQKGTITINEKTQECLLSNVDHSIVLVYAMDINNGEDDYYLYNKEDNTYLKYNDHITKDYEEKLAKYQMVLLAFAGVSGVFLLLIIFLLFKRKKRKEPKKSDKEVQPIKEEINPKQEKKKKKKSSKKEEPEEKKPEEIKVEKIDPLNKKKTKKTKEEALEQVTNAAKIIEDYEKTRELSKSELESIQTDAKEEDTMFDILENSKKKNRK